MTTRRYPDRRILAPLPPDGPGAIEERLRQRRAAEQAVRERQERYPILSAENAQEAIDWQESRIRELMSEVQS